MRKLLLLFVCAFVSIGTWADSLSSGGSYTVDGGVVTFSGTTAGAIASESNFNFGDAKRIKFDNTCVINKDDLEKFLQGNTYYVDLFDITKGDNAKMTPGTIDVVVTGAVADMVNKGWQAKGIILPLNTISGTSTVVKSSDLNNPKPTFTEYAAYYRDNTTQKTATIYAHDSNMSGENWQNITSNTDAQNHYNTAYAHLSSHSEVAQAETYIVSTNNKIKNSDQGLDVSNIPAYASVPEGAEPVPTTKITIINDEMVYKNSTSRTFLADIIVEGTAGAFAAAVANTNIKLTPCEELVFKGTVGSADIAAINSFTEAAGPLVYNLADAKSVEKSDLSSITNTKVEYIILPHAMAEEQIEKSCFSTSLTNSETFKAAIAASTDKKKLSAYVNVAGSLAKARCYATGNGADQAGYYKPAKQGLTSVILGGNLNASDISTKQENNKGLQDEYNTITSIDLEKAYFANVYDMRLGSSDQVQVNGQWVTMEGAGFQQSNVLAEVKLPTDPGITKIPEGCLKGIKSLQNLHIPYNYKKIGFEAFRETSIDHITTEDASHVLIDNGPNSYTFSANIDEIGEAGHQEGSPTFPQTVRIKDVYCLGAKAPKCYQATFPAQILAGNGGANEGIYCQDKYQGMGENEKCFALLHFPSLESYNNAGVKDDSYDKMVAHYTDPTRAYTKKDQTGAVDANGNPLVWPDQGELEQTYKMAKDGRIWKDYPNPSYEGEDYHLTNFGTTNEDPHDVTNENDPYSFRPDYTGWHEFVLSMASYVDPDEIVEQEDVVRYYEEAGWYTFCIPFDMTVSQVQEMLGVPASDPANHIISKFIENDGIHTVVDGTTVPAKMPEIRQLTKVTRLKGSGSQSNHVRFILTKDLYNNGDPLCLNFDHTQANPANVITRPSAGGDANDPICLVGGHPYLIKAYKRVNPGTRIDEYKISGQNLGKYILTRYNDNFKKEASCVNRSECMEQLGDNNLSTLQFARPFEEHKVQAMKDAEEAEYLYYNDGNGKKKPYHYTMAGQFWTQDLPKYCVYMSKGSWYRYTANKGYTWDPYKCIIMATPEVKEADVQAPNPETEGYQNVVIDPIVLASKHMGGKFRNFVTSKFPVVQKDTKDRLNNSFELRFVDGRDDDDFNQAAGSKFTFAFEDGITEFDDNGTEVTAIKNLDGEDIETMFATGKVYNMSGQYVGTSLDGLSKGMYIMNGKKYVVK